ALERAVRYGAYSHAAVERILSVQARPKTVLESLAEEERRLPPWLGEDVIVPRPTSDYQHLCESEPDRDEAPNTTSEATAGEGAPREDPWGLPGAGHPPVARAARRGTEPRRERGAVAPGIPAGADQRAGRRPSRAADRPPHPRRRLRRDQDLGRLRLAGQCGGGRSAPDRDVGRGRVHRPSPEPGLGGPERRRQESSDPGHRPECLCAGLSGALRDQRGGAARPDGGVGGPDTIEAAAGLQQVRPDDPRRVRLRPGGTAGIAPGGELAVQADQRPEWAVDGLGDEHRFRGMGRVPG